MMSIKNILISVIVAISVSNLVHASNFNKPHAHTGKVEPFVPGDPNVKLDGKAKSILKSGKPYQVNINCIMFLICMICKCISIYITQLNPNKPTILFVDSSTNGFNWWTCTCGTRY